VTADIEGSLHAFLCRRSPATRYASFDYCFNYFQDARDAQETAGLARGDQLELSCLHLGFYRLLRDGHRRGAGTRRPNQGLVPADLDPLPGLSDVAEGPCTVRCFRAMSRGCPEALHRGMSGRCFASRYGLT
jgi:hypothetical protein